MDRGAWRTIVHEAAKSQTQLSDCAHTRPAYSSGQRTQFQGRSVTHTKAKLLIKYSVPCMKVFHPASACSPGERTLDNEAKKHMGLWAQTTIHCLLRTPVDGGKEGCPVPHHGHR